jgi:hypothetical protein
LIDMPSPQLVIKSEMHNQLQHLRNTRRTLYEWGNKLIATSQGINSSRLRQIPMNIFLKPTFVKKMVVLNGLILQIRDLRAQGEMERAAIVNQELQVSLEYLAWTLDD